MARKTGALRTGEVTILRSATALIAAESATLTDANIPPAQGIDCTGLDTVLVSVEITAGTSPTMTIEALVRDNEAAVDGARWKRILLGSRDGVTAAALAAEDSGALDGVSFVEMRVFGSSLVFFRIKAVGSATSTTAWKILGMPGRIRPGHRPFR